MMTLNAFTAKGRRVWRREQWREEGREEGRDGEKRWRR